MSKNEIYGCFRYFLVPFNQQLSLLKENKLINRKVLMEGLLDNNETSLKLEENIWDGKYKIYLVSKLNEDNFLVKFGRHSIVTQTEDTGKDFKENELEDHPYIHTYINTKEQVVLFENKTKVFRDLKASANAFTKYFSEKVEPYGYEFKYEEISSPFKFWSLIDNADYLEIVSLNIYSPNLFDGSTPAEEAAKEFELVTGSTENILTFKNKHGKLKLAKDKFKSFIDYISAGGGTWFVKAKVPGINKNKFFSTDTTKRIYIPEDLLSRSDEGILDYIEPLIKSINHKPGDDLLNEKKENKDNKIK